MAREMPTIIDHQGIRRKEKQNQKSMIALSRAAGNVFKAISEAKVFNLSSEIAS